MQESLGDTVRNKARRENREKWPINEDLPNFGCLEHFIVRTEQRNENSLGCPCGVGGITPASRPSQQVTLQQGAPLIHLCWEHMSPCYMQGLE